MKRLNTAPQVETIVQLFNHSTSQLHKRCAITLVELMLTLAIIGIIAVITLPTSSKNIKELEYSIAGKRIDNMVWNSLAFVEANDGIRSASDAKDFVKNYLSKYLKMVKCMVTKIMKRVDLIHHPMGFSG